MDLLKQLQYQKKFLLYFIGLASLLVLFSIGILGIAGSRDFIQILIISGKGTGYGTNEIAMFNLIGLLTRIFPALSFNSIHLIGWLAYLISIITLSTIWARTGTIKTPHLSLAIIFSLFFAPHLHYHDLTLLIIPIFLLLISEKLPISQENLPLVPLAISFILIFTQPIPFLYYSLPYLLMLSLIIFMQREFRTHKNTGSFPNA